jgi:bacteriorhodopsin
MCKRISALAFTLLLLLTTSALLAQAPADGPVQMADDLRASGKIWVVVAVFITLILGIFVYLISLDRKISRLEKK